MSFFQRLQQETKVEQQYLLSAPIIERCFKGEICVDDYVAFLQQAYHHVKHTVPLLMSVGARLGDDQEWLRSAVAEYIEEEIGHQEWILNDIGHCGYDKDVARHSKPQFETEIMVAYSYDAINRKSPLSFFGLVHVLEGTSIAMADNAAASIGNALGLPKNAFSYLISHGSLDIEHVKFFEALMDKITDEKEQQVIIDAAKVFYKLYSNIFRNLSTSHGVALAA
ncbi:MAG: pyrroloquinoline quinone (PQQ) biosynthesis protein C [Alteromonadaceae bacterium]|jgi:pyrroloquinoline quinone (PQQ) biosynthesis protein C